MMKQVVHRSVLINPIAHYSVNQMFGKGKSRKYKEWKKYLDAIFKTYLPDDFYPHDADKYDIGIEIGTKSFDLDNVFKAYIDGLERRYNFNDSKVVRIVGRKVFVEEEHDAYLKLFLMDKVEYDDEELDVLDNAKQMFTISDEIYDTMRAYARSA